MIGVRAALAVVTALAVLATGVRAQDPEPQLIRMGTGSVAGVYFPVGVALCRLANQHRRETGRRCAAVPSAGSVQNVGGLRDTSLQLGIVQSDTVAEAVDGTAPFATAGPFPELRTVMALYSEPLTIVARADAGIARVEDLAGKRVVLGAAGSGTRDLADALIGALGWTPASFAAVPDVAPEAVSRALCSGEIDAFFYAVGHPARAIQEATTSCDAVLVDAAGPAVSEMIASRPYYVTATIPAGIYRGTDRAVQTFGVNATLMTRADVPDPVIHGLVQEVFQDFDMLKGLDPVLASLDPRQMAREGQAAPLHPGAADYYRERGWID